MERPYLLYNICNNSVSSYTCSINLVSHSYGNRKINLSFVLLNVKSQGSNNVKYCGTTLWNDLLHLNPRTPGGGVGVPKIFCCCLVIIGSRNASFKKNRISLPDIIGKTCLGWKKSEVGVA